MKPLSCRLSVLQVADNPEPEWEASGARVTVRSSRYGLVVRGVTGSLFRRRTWSGVGPVLGGWSSGVELQALSAAFSWQMG